MLKKQFNILGNTLTRRELDISVLCSVSSLYAKLTVSWLQLHIYRKDMTVALIFSSNYRQESE